MTERDGRVWRLRVTREREPADPADVEFIGHARADVAALLSHLRGTRRLSPGELDRIARRAEAAKPDLYLWRGDEPAADGDFEFVAAARQDIPHLLDAARA